MSDQSNNLTPRIPPTLSSVPTEVLAHICSFMDKNTAISFARASRRCTSSANTRIWRDLELALPSQFGVYWPFQELRDGEDIPWSAYYEWLHKEEEEQDGRHRAGVSGQTRMIMLRMDEERSKMVRTIQMFPRAGVVDAQIQLLELVSPSLRALNIESRNRSSSENLTADTLDFKVLDYTLHFPALTRIHIATRTIHFVGFLSVLVSASPSLISLDVDCARHRTDDSDSDDGKAPAYPLISQSTQITHFRLSSTYYHGDDCETDDIRHILSLFEYSPRIEVLCLSIVVGDTETLERRQLAGAVWALPALQDLHLADGLDDIQDCYGDVPVSDTARRLVVASFNWWTMFQCLPDIPSLEVLVIDEDDKQNLEPPASVTFPEPIFARAMIPTFSSSLRRLSKLHTVHTAPISDLCRNKDVDLSTALDQVMNTGPFTCVIRSITHCGSEILQARTLDYYRQISDVSAFGQPQDRVRRTFNDWGPLPKGDPTAFTYTDCDGSARSKSFHKLSKPVFTDYTDFEGHVVPLEIIARMRMAEGAEEEEWQGRGIEVGPVAWKVLTDWRDGLVGAGSGANQGGAGMSSYQPGGIYA